MDCWKNAVGPRIKRVNNAIDFWRTQDMDRLGLTTTQGYLLGWLTRNADKSVTPSELGRSFKLSQPTISGILQRLEAKGFVTMEADSNDRRRKYIRTTDRAAECHQQIVSNFRDMERRLTAPLSAEEQETLLALLDRMIDGLEQGVRQRETEDTHV
jgi:DNA-binding MarR family transcriptional regulator